MALKSPEMMLILVDDVHNERSNNSPVVLSSSNFSCNFSKAVAPDTTRRNDDIFALPREQMKTFSRSSCHVLFHQRRRIK